MATSKNYIYKVYDRSLNYVGTWNDVVSDFATSEDLNGPGGQVAVELARPADNFGEGVDVDFGFQVKVYVEDGDDINGKLVFTGFISNYVPTYGAGEGLKVTIMGYGWELDDIIIQADITNDQTQTGGSTEQSVDSVNKVAQSFVAGNANLDQVTLKMRVGIPQNISVAIHSDSAGVPSAAPFTSLASVTNLVSDTTAADQRFVFPARLTLVVGATYWIVITGPTVSTSVFYAENDYGSIRSGGAAGATWLNARAGTGLEINNPSMVLGSGGSYNSGYEATAGPDTNGAVYWAYEGFCKFDTSAIPDTATIQSASLITRLYNSPSGGGVTNNAYLSAFNIPLTTAAWVAGASLAALTKLAHIATSNATPTNTDLTWTNDNLVANINKSGYTDMLIDTTSQEGVGAPVSSADVTHNRNGTNPGDFRPRLSVTYADVAYVIKNTAGGYGSGLMATYNGSTWTTVSGSDLYFKTQTTSGLTTIAYLSQDPGAILRDIMDKYIAQGGNLSYDTSTIELTGTTVSYTFNTNTTLEGLKKCLELAPANWYFYIDQANNMVHFHQKSGAVQRTFVLGKDIVSLSPKKTIENMVNVVYFTGGGTPALFLKFQNATSIGLYGIKAIKYVDQRVTTAGTAETIAENLLEQHNAPEMQLEFEIIDNNVDSTSGYDIEVITLGEVMAIRNTGGTNSSLWDNAMWDADYWDFNIRDLATALLQITRLDRKPGSIKIFCSTTPPDVNKRIEDINRNLEASQTVNNPTAPS